MIPPIEGMVISRISFIVYGGPRQNSSSSNVRILFPFNYEGSLQRIPLGFWSIPVTDFSQDFNHRLSQSHEIGLSLMSRAVFVKFKELTTFGICFSLFPFKLTSLTHWNDLHTSSSISVTPAWLISKLVAIFMYSRYSSRFI